MSNGVRRMRKFGAAAFLKERRRQAAKRRRARLLRVAIPAFLLLVAAVQLAGLRGSSERIPAELVGVWVSDDPRYAGRALELTADRLSFHAVGDNVAPHRVRIVTRREGAGGRVRYVIEYSDGGRPSKVALTWLAEFGVLVLDHPGDVSWRLDPRTGD